MSFPAGTPVRFCYALTFGFVFSLLLGIGLSEHADHDKDVFFEKAVDRRTELLEDAWDRQKDILWAMEGLYVASSNVTTEEFHNFMGMLYHTQYGRPWPSYLMFLGWIPAAGNNVDEPLLQQGLKQPQLPVYARDAMALDDMMAQTAQGHMSGAILGNPFTVADTEHSLTLVKPMYYPDGRLRGHVFTVIHLPTFFAVGQSAKTLLHVSLQGADGDLLFEESTHFHHKDAMLTRPFDMGNLTFNFSYALPVEYADAVPPYVYLSPVIMFLLWFMGVSLWYQLWKHQQDMHAAQQRAEESNRLKSEFLANMSHEIRTPLNGIIGMAQLLLKSKLTPRQTLHGQTIVGSAENLLHIINDILDFSKIEAGHMEFSSVKVSLPDLLHQTAMLFSARAQGKGLELLTDTLQGVPVTVEADPVRLQQVLHNFLNNAIKFTAKGYVMLSVQVLKREGQAVTLKFSVKDTGIGVAPDKLKHVFERFTQADGSTTRQYGGTGLGLAICKQLAEAMGGMIGAESVPGEGSTFWVSLPLTVVAEEGLPPAPLPVRHVLVLDGLSASAQMLTRQLEGMGLLCQTGGSVPEGLALLHEAALARQPFDMVFLNENLAGLQPKEFIRHMKDAGYLARTDVFFLAGYNRFQTDETELEGMTEVFAKPLHPVKLQAALARVLTGGKLGRRAAPQEDEIAEVQDDVHGFSCPNLRILVVEDNPTNVLLMREVLGGYGAKTVFATDGEEALERAQRQQFDLILMDCQMPKMDGYETVQHLHSLYALGKLAHLPPIVALTANAMEDDRAKCLRAGMQDYLAKPIREAELVAVLKKWGGVRVSVAQARPEPKPEVIAKVNDKPVLKQTLVDRKLLEELNQLTRGKLRPVLEMFLETGDAAVDDLKAAVRQKDVVALIRIGHNFKSSGAQVGAMPLSDAGKNLEELLVRAQRKIEPPVTQAQITGRMQDLLSVYGETAEVFRGLLAQPRR